MRKFFILIIVILVSINFSTGVVAAKHSFGSPNPPVSVGKWNSIDQTICSQDEQCANDGYCSKPPGMCDGEGVCKTKPQICTMQYDPVCGCDNNTYSSACNAAAVGIGIAKPGECAIKAVP